MRILSAYLALIKSGIVSFVLISGFAGFALSMPPGEPWNWQHLGLLLCSLFFTSSGSFAINEAQEWMIDKRMNRTAGRPIPAGTLSAFNAYAIGTSSLLIGLALSYWVNPLVAWLSFLTALLYNGFYTMWWKKQWAFGAVPGAIPGALPVVIGFAANSELIFSGECIYAFLIMFLWQMPHFWSLAIRYKDDYAAGGIPVLPTQIGTERTLYHIGLYIFAYIGLAVASPWITTATVCYALFVLPFSIKVFVEFFKFFRSQGEQKWLPFFLWTNFSMLVFLLAPVIDKWHHHYSMAAP